ncbi:MAG: hypothetical protein ACFFDW_00970 [Candidatus Thorarchaeota archaeon]
MNGIGNIEDTLTEIIKLRNVKIALVEWLPFDRNQLSALNIKLDSLHRRRGHIVTALKDDSPENMVFKDDGVSCKVIVEDFEPSEYVSFHAYLNFPEDEGIVQKEELSGNINSWGRVVYGADLVHVDGSKENWISLDILTRIIVDLTMDTSQMIDSLLTEYQRNLLDLIFMNESAKRTKFILIMADEISEHPGNSEDFFDGEEYQNELEQVIGSLQQITSLDNGYFFKGTSGLIAVSSKIKDYELSYIERSISSAIRTFLDDYSAVIWHLWDESKHIELDIDKAMLGDIASLTRAQNWITRASSDAIMLSDILSYLRDSITEFVNDLLQEDPSRSMADPLIRELQTILDDSHITTKRVNDTQKVIHGLESKMVALRDFSNALAEKHMRRLSDSMAQNTKFMTQMTESNNRASDALSIIELILAGSVIIDIVLIIVGEYGYPDWLNGVFGDFKYGSLLVFGITLILWIAMFVFLRLSKRRLESSAIKRQRGTYMIGKRCNIENLERYLTTKNIIMKNTEYEGESELVSATWEPEQNKDKIKPKISNVVLSYDAQEKFLIQVDIESPDMKINLKQCFDHLMEEMSSAGVFNLSD